ncbi:hypothetical protein [Aeromonas hydrophila]|uniref:hypothetical protein n=1 Tax=Aeromonas hydrophila TaxID=644 RepID=UPI003D1B834F
MNQAVKIELESADPAEIAIDGNENAPLPDANLALLLELERGRVKGLVQAGKLTDVVISDQNEKIAELSAELELNSRATSTLRGEVASLTMELTTAKAKLAGQEKLLARLGGATAEATSAALQAKQQALDMLGQQVVELEERVVELEGLLATAQEQAKAAGDASGRAADANARLRHSEEQREALAAEGIRLLRDCKALRDDLDKALSENEVLTQELEKVRAALSRADVAKKNALDAQAAQFSEQIRGMTAVADGMAVISKSELAALRNKAKQADDLQEDLNRTQTKLDGVNEVMGAYRTKINHLEQLVESAGVAEERAAGLLKEMHGRYMAAKLDLDYTLMAMRMFNNQPEYKSDSGRLTIMSLDPKHLQSEDRHTIHPNTPLCWWNTKGGLGCVTMLSAEPAEDGEHYLIFPSFSATIPGVEGVVDIAKAVMPPKEEWPAIIEHMKKLDSAQMTRAMDAGHEAATRFAHLSNPDALPVIAASEDARRWREGRAAKRAAQTARAKTAKRKGRK